MVIVMINSFRPTSTTRLSFCTNSSETESVRTNNDILSDSDSETDSDSDREMKNEENYNDNLTLSRETSTALVMNQSRGLLVPLISAPSTDQPPTHILSRLIFSLLLIY
jgi:hypothetical protein